MITHVHTARFGSNTKKSVCIIDIVVTRRFQEHFDWLKSKIMYKFLKIPFTTWEINRFLGQNTILQFFSFFWRTLPTVTPTWDLRLKRRKTLETEIKYLCRQALDIKRKHLCHVTGPPLSGQSEAFVSSFDIKEEKFGSCHPVLITTRSC